MRPQPTPLWLRASRTDDNINVYTTVAGRQPIQRSTIPMPMVVQRMRGTQNRLRIRASQRVQLHAAKGIALLGLDDITGARQTGVRPLCTRGGASIQNQRGMPLGPLAEGCEQAGRHGSNGLPTTRPRKDRHSLFPRGDVARSWSVKLQDCDPFAFLQVRRVSPFHWRRIRHRRGLQSIKKPADRSTGYAHGLEWE